MLEKARKYNRIKTAGSIHVATSAKAYLITVVSLGVVVLWVAFTDWHCASPLRLGVYLFLALLSGTLKIPGPGIPGTYSMLFLFVLFGAAAVWLPQTLRS